jgi:hypothetical protein
MKRKKLNLFPRIIVRSQLPNQRKNLKKKLRKNYRQKKIKKLRKKPRKAKMTSPKKIQKWLRSLAILMSRLRSSNGLRLQTRLGMRGLGRRTLSKLEVRRLTLRSRPRDQPLRLLRRDQRQYRHRRNLQKLKRCLKLLGKSQKIKLEKEVN